MQLNPIEAPELRETPAVKVAVEHPEKAGHLDGVPHDVVGVVALVCVLVSGATLLAFFAFGDWGAVPVGVLSAWLMMRRLPRRARRERVAEAVAEQPHAADRGPDRRSDG